MFNSRLETWFAIRTLPNQERRVAAALESKGIESYCPVFEQVHAWSDRRVRVETPLFPGYTFARFACVPEQRVRVVRTSGAVKILGAGDRPEPVPDSEIDAIRVLLESKRACWPHPFLRQGDRVRICRGPLRGLEGILLRTNGGSRLVLSVGLLCQSVATEIAAADVEPAGQRPAA
jgi:transcription antitermination factor NusG